MSGGAEAGPRWEPLPAVSRRTIVVDGVAGGTVALLSLPFAVPFGWPAAVLAIAMGASIAVRRSSPFLALVIAWAGVLQQLLCVLPPLPANAAILVLLYSTANFGDRATRSAGLGSAIVGGAVAGAYTLGQVILQDPRSPTTWALVTAVSVAAVFVLALSWTIGLVVRSSRRAASARQAGVVADESRRRAEQQAVALEERNRIARDMHDVVAHSLAVVIAQADGARYVLRADPELAERSVETISDTARQALGEVRVLLAELRHAQPEGPQPGVADVGALVEQLRAAGLDIRVGGSGSPRGPLPKTHDMAIYRIVQESLTNALRHGDRGAPVDLRVDWLDDGVGVTVENAVAPTDRPVSAGSGHGVHGMRERATLTGGRLSAGPSGPWRFRVSAFVPASAAAAAPPGQARPQLPPTETPQQRRTEPPR